MSRYCDTMNENVKFSSKMRADLLERLRQFASESQTDIYHLLNQAVAEFLDRAHLRPAFVETASEIVVDHAELLERLAKS